MFRSRTYKYHFDEWGFEKTFSSRKFEARMRRIAGLPVDVDSEERKSRGSSTVELKLKEPAKEV
jgi:hypothetical protein